MPYSKMFENASTLRTLKLPEFLEERYANEMSDMFLDKFRYDFSSILSFEEFNNSLKAPSRIMGADYDGDVIAKTPFYYDFQDFDPLDEFDVMINIDELNRRLETSAIKEKEYDVNAIFESMSWISKNSEPGRMIYDMIVNSQFRDTPNRNKRIYHPDAMTEMLYSTPYQNMFLTMPRQNGKSQLMGLIQNLMIEKMKDGV